MPSGITISLAGSEDDTSENDLEKAEDELMEVDPREHVDLEFHCNREGKRARIFLLQNRTMRRLVNRRCSQILWLLGLGIGSLWLKGLVTFSDVMHAFFTFAGGSNAH